MRTHQQAQKRQRRLFFGQLGGGLRERDSAGRNAARRPGRRFTPLVLESLEPRTLLAAVSSLDPLTYDPSSILVRFRETGGVLNAASAVSGSQTLQEALQETPGLKSIELSSGVHVEEALESYRTRANVQYAEPNYLVHADVIPDDTQFGELWALHNTAQGGGALDADIDAPEAWNSTTGSSSIVVGVIDTGVDYRHPDLAANIWTNPGEIAGNGIDDDGNGFVDDVHGYDFLGTGDSDPMDENRHGTHVAGTIGAVGNNGLGVAGVSWRVQIMPLKFLDSGGSGTVADAIEAINYATMMRKRGVNIVMTSNSWSGSDNSLALQDAIAASGAANMLFVAAAGNGSNNTDIAPSYPASFPHDNIISVAATDRSDARASFSNWGATSVDLAAPGVDVLSTLPNNGYGRLNGTSMATPHVTGVAALAWSIAGNTTYQVVRDAIFAGVDPNAAFARGGPTPVATGGRLNAFRTLQALGLLAGSNSPGAGSTVSTPPISYVIDFSAAVDSASVQAGDLTVDGLPASKVVLSATKKTATFSFLTNPVKSQGLHTLRIAAGAIAKHGDSAVAIHDFTAQFRYDTEATKVVSTNPPVGAAISPATSLSYDVQFNEPLDPASVQATDLVLSGQTGARVASASIQPGNMTVRFTLADISGEGTLVATIPAHALTDVFGNPSPEIRATYSVDRQTTAFPTPFAAVRPLGSLVYESRTAAGIIGSIGDRDSFTLVVDGGQTITSLATPTSGDLWPRLQVHGPDGALLGTSEASAAGGKALLQTITAPARGEYTVTVSGVSTTGGYKVGVTLNAALESEDQGGATNNSLANAQDIQGSSVRFFGGAERLAVTGSIDGSPIGVAEDFESGVLPPSITTYSSNDSGRIRIMSPGGAGNSSSMALRMDFTAQASRALIEAVYRVNLSGTSNAHLRFSYIRTGEAGVALPDNFSGHFNGDGVSISDDGIRWHTILSAHSWNTRKSWTSNNAWATTTIDLAAVAAATGMQLGPNFQVKFQRYDNHTNLTDAHAYDDIQFLRPDPQDTYAIALAAGDTISAAAKALGSGSARIRLFDSSGALQVSGISGLSNADELIGSFEATTAGTYYLAVSGAIDTRYSALVAKNTWLDLESKDYLYLSQEVPSRQVAGEQWVLGRLGDIDNSTTYPVTDDYDYYRITLNSGATLTAESFLPTAESAPGNTLDPELYIGNSKVTLASDKNSADGRNARVRYTNTGPTGTFSIAIGRHFGNTSGEYALKITGAQVTSRPFEAGSSRIDYGVWLPAPPRAYIVDFNNSPLASTVQPSDLTIDGALSATGVTYLDGDTVSFTLPSLSTGEHTFSLAAGALLDTRGTPLAQFSKSFAVDDGRPPRIVGISVPPEDAPLETSSTIQVTFSEPVTFGTNSVRFSRKADPGSWNSADWSSLDSSRTVLTLKYSNLREDEYVLSLSGSESGFKDSNGFPLDGEFLGTFPSGDGVAGGSLQFDFRIDAGTREYLTPILAMEPRGSLAYEASRAYVPSPGMIAPAGDRDSYTLSLTAGQVISAVVEVFDGKLRPQIEVRDPENAIVASVQAPGEGRSAIFQAVPIAINGTYTFTVSGGDNSTGRYHLWLRQNASAELEQNLGARTNQNAAAAENIDSAFFTPAGAPPSVQQAAVLGFGDVTPFHSYEVTSVPPTFQDISTTGFRSKASGRGGSETLNMGSFAFPFYGNSYRSFTISTNGVLSFDGSSPSNNTNLMDGSSRALIAPFWDALVVEGTGTGAASKAIYWQMTGSGPNQQLVFQWNNVQLAAFSVYFTFQAVLSLDGTIQFNYSNVPAYLFSSATVGLNGQQSSTLVSHNQPPSSLVGAGLSIQLKPPSSVDYYAFALNAGEMATISASIAYPQLFAGAIPPRVELRDSNDILLAAGQVGVTNLGSFIKDFAAPSSGIYYAKVIGSYSEIEYNLVVTKNAEFDTEPNSARGSEQEVLSPNVAGNQWVVGYVDHLSPDIYKVTVAGGDTLVAQTYTPKTGTNTLNARLTILDMTGKAVAVNDHGAPDGRNAFAQFTNSGGTSVFFVQVEVSSGTGEYALRVSGSTAVPPLFAAQNAAVTSDGPGILTAKYRVQFNHAHLPTSIQPADLIIDGALSATSVETTADSAVFHLPPLEAGEHTFQLTGGSIVDLHGTPLMVHSTVQMVDGVTPEDTALGIRLPREIVQVEGLIVSPPQYGTLSGTAPYLTYMPRANYSGLDRFTFRAVGGDLTTIPITIAPVNDRPDFNAGPSQLGPQINDEAGLIRVERWATQIYRGAADEADQTLHFVLSVPPAQQNLFLKLPAIDPSGHLTYTPRPNAEGTANVSVVLRDDGGTEFGGEDSSVAQTFTIAITKPRAFYNAALPPDASGDGLITVHDAVLVINLISTNGFGSAPPTRPAGRPYYDVNGDGMFSTIDAVLIINTLHQPLVSGAEGEASESSPNAASGDEDEATLDLIAADAASQMKPKRRR